MPSEILRILVVDDETGMRLAIARVLNTFQVRLADEADGTAGFEVQTAETGEEALEKIGRAVPGHPAPRPEAARHLGAGRLEGGQRAWAADPDGDDHRVRDARDRD